MAVKCLGYFFVKKQGGRVLGVQLLTDVSDDILRGRRGTGAGRRGLRGVLFTLSLALAVLVLPDLFHLGVFPRIIIPLSSCQFQGLL